LVRGPFTPYTKFGVRSPYRTREQGLQTDAPSLWTGGVKKANTTIIDIYGFIFRKIRKSFFFIFEEFSYQRSTAVKWTPNKRIYQIWWSGPL